MLEDAGRSLSPLVDIGQIEGGFVMGQGLLTTEKVVFDSTTGKRLTDSVWVSVIWRDCRLILKWFL